MVASGEFDAPQDAVVSPDGEMFYFTAHTQGDEAAAAIFSVPSKGGTVNVLHQGDPLDDPVGLLMSCDGDTLYVADFGFDSADLIDDETGSPIYKLELGSNTLSAVDAGGIGQSTGLAMAQDCSTLYVTGYTETGEPALFTLNREGGQASTVLAGDPLKSPSGVHVDNDSVAWVMDQMPGDISGGALWAIDTDGNANRVVDGLKLSEPAGVSLVAGGGTAIIPTRDADDNGQLLAVEIATGEVTIIEAAEMQDPAGIRTARNAGVMAVVDTDGDAIYRAE
jgi:sugar lactone lactonase YvrE